MLPNSNDLYFFLEVAATENMSRAAERLGISQPALSQAMKRLEHNFEQELLVRGKNGVQLTKAGEKLTQKARKLLEDWEHLKESSKREEESLVGRYSLGIHTSVALYTLKKFLPQLLKSYSGLNFKLEHDLSRKITEDVISFKLDFGLVVNPVGHPDLVIKELFKDEVCFFKAKKSSGLNDLDSEDKVLIAEPDLNQTQQLLAKTKKQIQFTRYLTSSSLEVIKDLVLSGAGIGIIPTRVVGNEIKKLEKLDSLPKFTDRICLVYRADLQKSQAARFLSREIQKFLT